MFVLSVDCLTSGGGLASAICNRQCQRPRSFAGDAITCFQVWSKIIQLAKVWNCPALERAAFWIAQWEGDRGDVASAIRVGGSGQNMDEESRILIRGLSNLQRGSGWQIARELQFNIVLPIPLRVA